MARTNYPEELTALVEEYLTDGAISGKERQVLLKKAEKLGIDVDEFDLYIDAQIQKIDFEADNLIRKAKGRSCPYCGKTVPQLADQCPHCGQYISAQACEELEEILENLEDALEDVKSGYDVARNKTRVEKYTRKARMYYSKHPKIQAILAEVAHEMAVAESMARKSAIKHGIANFLGKIGKFLIKCIFLLFPVLIVIVITIFSYKSCYNQYLEDKQELRARLDTIPETHRENSTDPPTPFEETYKEYEHIDPKSTAAVFAGFIFVGGVEISVFFIHYIYTKRKKH